MAEKTRNKVGPWVIGEDFFNREAEVERLTQLIDEGHNVLLVAPRRIGKTSLVRETFRRMDARERDYLLFVDVQDCKTPEDVIVEIALAAQPYGNLKTKFTDAFDSLLNGVRDNVDSIFELRFREAIVGDWRAKARKIVQTLAEADRSIVICLDELPIMLNRLITKPGDPAEHRVEAEVFLSWLRRAFTAHPDKVRWIVCGSIGLEPILARHNLSFTIGHLRALHLPPWDRATADACLRSLAAGQGYDWPEECREVLLDRLAHFIPHHVQMYFGHVIDDWRRRGATTLTAEDVDRVWHKHMLSTRGHAELADYEERLLRVLEKTAVDLALALLTEAAVVGRLKPAAAAAIVENHRLDHSEKSLRDVLRVLEHDGYLERDGDSGGWVFVSPLIRDWWSRRFGTGYEPVSTGE